VFPVAAPITNSPVSLTHEEENAVRYVHYVGGYVVRVLHQQKENSNTTDIIEAMIDTNAERPAQDWIKTIDRNDQGGLVHISDKAF